MKLAPCNKHKGDHNLICFKIRHDNGDEATQQEIWAEIVNMKKVIVLCWGALSELQPCADERCNQPQSEILELALKRVNEILAPNA